jgi:hypothetical protein
MKLAWADDGERIVIRLRLESSLLLEIAGGWVKVEGEEYTKKHWVSPICTALERNQVNLCRLSEERLNFRIFYEAFQLVNILSSESSS